MTRFAERAVAISGTQKPATGRRAAVLRWCMILAVCCLAVPTSSFFWFVHHTNEMSVHHANSYTRQDGMPELFYYGGKVWFIVADASKGWDDWLDQHNADAITDCERHVVVLRSTLPRTERVDALFHEFLHVGACGAGTLDQEAQYYNSMTMKDHGGIERVALVYTSLFKENPELAAYMSGPQQ